MLEGGPGLTEPPRVTMGRSLPSCADGQSGTSLLGVPSEEQTVTNAPIPPGPSLNRKPPYSQRDC